MFMVVVTVISYAFALQMPEDPGKQQRCSSISVMQSSPSSSSGLKVCDASEEAKHMAAIQQSVQQQLAAVDVALEAMRLSGFAGVSHPEFAVLLRQLLDRAQVQQWVISHEQDRERSPTAACWSPDTPTPHLPHLSEQWPDESHGAARGLDQNSLHDCMRVPHMEILFPLHLWRPLLRSPLFPAHQLETTPSS